MKRYFFSFSFTILFFPFVYAQKTQQNINENPSQLILKFSLLSFIDITPSLQFALEYRSKFNKGIQAEYGYIVNSYFENSQKLQGYRLRSEIRFYNKLYPSMYFASELLLKKFYFINTGDFGIDCENGDCAYHQIADYTVNKKMSAGHLKIGVQKNFKSEKLKPLFFYDLYIGVGIRHINTYLEGKPKNSIKESSSFTLFFDETEGRKTYSSMTLGFKLGYLLK